ncbi:cation:proton antiporter [Puniceicoccaceae bacterium K14]|nr:cation:proton antiporter [Puniceicoccaceae bacterium K14]
MHETNILNDLAWIMFAAAIAALTFHKLKLPPLLGYIAAGFAIGPQGLSPDLIELSNVLELSELGVVFLMFYIGLEFDLSKLKKVLMPAFLALSLQTLLMLFVGMEASRWLGLSPLNGWFLGGILSISSSMVSVKLMREKKLFHRPHGQTAVGILIFEDFLAILFLVLLSGVAQRGTMDYTAVGRSILFIGIFVVAIFLLGKLSAPRVMKALESRGTTETVTLTTLGLIFGVSLVAEAFHLSWALGGFLAGAILSRTILAHQIEKITEPLRDLFSALFFVSVGMLIDPLGIWQNAPAILLISAIVIVGKFASCWFGLFLSGQKPMSAGRASLVKSQTGEFGFVITAIGAKYAVTDPALQSIASGVAFVTILATPTLISNQDKILNFIERFSPRAAKEFCTLFEKWELTLRLALNKNTFLQLARKPILRIAIHFLLVNAIIIAAAIISEHVSSPSFLPISQLHFQQGIFMLSILCSLPFLVDTMRNMNVLVLLFSDAALSRSVFQQFSRGAYRSVFNGLILILMLFIYGSVFLIIAAPYFPTGSVFTVFLILALIFGFIFWKKLILMHNGWEKALIDSMNHENEEQISKQIESNLKNLRTNRPWNVEVKPIILETSSQWSGQKIRDLDLRNQTGALIAGMERGGFELETIAAETRLYPNDKIFLLGEINQINQAANLLNKQSATTKEKETNNFAFAKIPIPPFCQWIGVPIMGTDIRDDFNVTIVGIQRDNRRIVGPSPSEILLEGDLLLLMGAQEKLQAFESSLSE